MDYKAALFNLIVQDWINSGYVDAKGGDSEQLLAGERPLRNRDESELEDMVSEAYVDDGDAYHPAATPGTSDFRIWVLFRASSVNNWYGSIWFGAASAG